MNASAAPLGGRTPLAEGGAPSHSPLAAIHARFPGIVVVPAHDARAAAELPVFPASRG